MFRVETAPRLLEHSENNLGQVARQCGFGDEERMGVTFQRNLGVTPSDYRKRFSAREDSASSALSEPKTLS